VIPLLDLRIRKYVWICLPILIFYVQADGIAANTAQNLHAAVATIETLHATLLSTMKNARTMGYKGRYQHLEPIIRQSYDFPKVVQITSGKYWRHFSKSQRLQFIHTFSRLVIATYAHRFDAYSGESFHTVATVSSRHGRVIVRTVLIKHDHTQVHLDYLLQQHKGRWNIINVVAQGVSDLALKRVEYTRVLRHQGFNTLMAKLKGKIAQYE